MVTPLWYYIVLHYNYIVDNPKSIYVDSSLWLADFHAKSGIHLGLGDRGVYVNSSIVDKGALAKASPL